MRKPYGKVSYWQVREAGKVDARRNTPPGPDRDTEMRHLADEEEFTLDAIALLYGVSRARVHQIVRKR